MQNNPSGQPPSNNFSKISQWLQESVAVKLMAIGFLTLLLLIPNALISDLIRERQFRQSEVEQEVNRSWGGEQTVVGPVLSVPYTSYLEYEDGKRTPTKHTAYFLPKQLDIKGDLAHQIRRRSIFDVVLYQADLTLSGAFEQPDFAALRIDPALVDWEAASISVGIQGMTGIKEVVSVNWNDSLFRMEPGTASQELLRAGVSTDIPLEKEGKEYQFMIPIKLNGSGTIQFEPVGKSTNIRLASDWPSPSFEGAFLPDNREFSPAGFTADWQVLDLNRSYPQQWVDNHVVLGNNTLGVRLIKPVDEYLKNSRSAKYAILIIGLTFLLYFFFEVLQKLLIHPFQYLLVGLAITIFYLLLLSLSEHIGFNMAYLISSIATIFLITGYSWSFLGVKKLVRQLFLLLAAIYGFIFILLQLEDFALLAGSIGVFIALAAVMYSSRKVNWYDLGERGKN